MIAFLWLFEIAATDDTKDFSLKFQYRAKWEKRHFYSDTFITIIHIVTHMSYL